MAEEMNPDNNSALLDTVLNTIKWMESRGSDQPYQLTHKPVEIYIYGTEAERDWKVKQFNKEGFVTKTKNGRPTVVATALGAYGILDINFNRFAKEAGLVDFNFRDEDGKAWQDAAVQDKLSRALAEKYFDWFGSWDLVRVAWFGGPERAKEGRDDGIETLPDNVISDLNKFRNQFSTEVQSTPPTTIGQADVEMIDPEGNPNDWIPAPEDGFDPRHIQPPPFEPSNINVPSQGPMGRPERMVAKLLASLVPESSRGIVEKNPGSPREIRNG